MKESLVGLTTIAILFGLVWLSQGDIYTTKTNTERYTNHQNEKNKNIDVETLDLFKKIHTINKDYPLALWVLSEDEISKGNKQEAVILLKNLLENLTQGDEEYIFIFNKIEELKN